MPVLFEHPYAAFLHKVAKPNRYTGAEHGVTRKDWGGVDARVCLAFPDVYDIGMSHLGYRILYKILNDDARTLAERCYMPWFDMQRELNDHGKLLVSLESARPLADFDVVGFSLQFELTYSNVLAMLDLGGIPLRSEHRSDDDPLIIAGGPVATHAEPMAPFFDALLIGDGEQALTEIALAWTADKRERIPRNERLRRLARIGGVYVPSLYRTAIDPDSRLEVVTAGTVPEAALPVERRFVADLSRFPFPDSGPVGGPEAIFDRMSIEVARGCTEGCRFCQAGMIYRPVRERDPAEIVATVERALEKSGQDEVSLTALSTADLSTISPLIKTLAAKTAPERVSLGVASLRAYGLGEDLLDAMGQVRASGLTFAPEAGTQRMRDVINKNVTEAQLLETAERVFSRGFDKMKLYFILGLPTETDEDVLGIIEVGKNALAVGKRLGRRATVTVSVSTHVPKPHTPFQWCAQDGLDEVRRKQEMLRGAARGARALKLRMHESGASLLEGILARGDRRLAAVIERAFLRGARFDSWDDGLDLERWQEALDHFGIDASVYLGTIPVGARLPWDHIDVGLEDGFLAREYRKALSSRLSPPCGKAAGMFIHHTSAADAKADPRRLVCYDCGIACDMSKMRAERVDRLVAMGAVEPPPRREREPSEVAQRRQKPEMYRPARPGSPPVRWRLRFSKLGPFALLGHLDMIRELPRVMRRAGLRIAYSEGFHPKPELSFAPALALGIASLSEYVDVKLIDPPSADAILAQLGPVVPPGLEFSAAVPLGPNDAGLSRVITGAEYVVGVAETALDGLGGRDGLELCIATLVAAETASVRRNTDGVGRMIDVKKSLRRLVLGGDSALAVLGRAGVVGHLVPLELSVAIAQSGTVRLVEILEALTGEPSFPFLAVRSELLAGSASPLDLEHCRPAAFTVTQSAAPADTAVSAS